MHKIVTFAVVAGISICCFADRTSAQIRAEMVALETSNQQAGKDNPSRAKERTDYWMSLTDAEVRAYLDDAIAYGLANRSAGHVNSRAALYLSTYGFQPMYFLLSPRFDAIRAEYDGKLAQLGFLVSEQPLSKFPKCNAELFQRSGMLTQRPIYMQYVAAAVTNGEDSIRIPKQLASRTELLAESIAYSLSANGTKFMPLTLTRVGWGKKDLSDVALFEIKRTLRKQGKSFVAAEGQANPVEKPMADFVSALDAPRFAGLKEWCDEWCPEASQYAVALAAVLPSQGKVSDLQDAILTGDAKFDDESKGTLLLCLGVEGYNSFVKEYNFGNGGK